MGRTTRSRRRKRGLGLVAASLAMVLVTVLLAAGVPAEAAFSPPINNAQRSMGLGPGNVNAGGYDRVVHVEDLINKQVNVVVQTLGHTQQSMLSNSNGLFAAGNGWPSKPRQYRMAVQVPLTFGTNGKVSTPERQAEVRGWLAASSSGANDAAYRTVAQQLKAAGKGDSIIRLGHEMDGPWSPWSAIGNCNEYIAAFRHVHDVFTAVSPDFKFDYNGTRPQFQATAACAYPGDAYVDMIGLDFYDRNAPTAYKAPDGSGWIDPQKTWTDIYQPVLNFHLAFAKSHGKPISFPEWGVQAAKPDEFGYAGSGMDDPTFIRNMYAWLNSLPASGAGSVAYHAYFWEGPFSLDDARLPLSRAAFLETFGAGGSGGSTTTTTTKPSTTTTTTKPTTTNTMPTTTTTTPGAKLADLVVKSIAASPSSPTAGTQVRFSAVIANIGNAATPSGVPIDVGFKVDDARVAWSDSDGTPLAAGASRTITAVVTWKATKGTHRVQANVDGANLIPESDGANLGNATLTVR